MVILEYMFSARRIRIVDRAISSMDFPFSIVIDAGFSLWPIASTYLLMISMSCIISFHKAKFLSSNFLILIPVLNVEAIFVSGWGWPGLLLSLVRVLLLSFIFFCFSSPLCNIHSNTTWRRVVRVRKSIEVDVDRVFWSWVLCKADERERERERARERDVHSFNGNLHDTIITELEYYNNAL